MTETELLTMLKANLEIVTDYMDDAAREAKDTELTQYLDASQEFITREGIALTGSTGDAMLIVQYASWLYGRRHADGSYGAMPRMLRWNLNNRLMEQDINGRTDG